MIHINVMTVRLRKALNVRRYRERNLQTVRSRDALNQRIYRKRRRRAGYLRINRQHKPQQYLFYAARGRAKEFNIPFNLTIDDVVIPEVCPVFGIPLIVNRGKGPCSNSPSLDRVRPELGYVKGNVAVISHRANVIKNDGTYEEHLRVAAYIKDTHGTVT